MIIDYYALQSLRIGFTESFVPSVVVQLEDGLKKKLQTVHRYRLRGLRIWDVVGFGFGGCQVPCAGSQNMFGIEF